MTEKQSLHIHVSKSLSFFDHMQPFFFLNSLALTALALAVTVAGTAATVCTTCGVDRSAASTISSGVDSGSTDCSSGPGSGRSQRSRRPESRRFGSFGRRPEVVFYEEGTDLSCEFDYSNSAVHPGFTVALASFVACRGVNSFLPPLFADGFCTCEFTHASLTARITPQLVAQPMHKQAPRACRGVVLHGPLACGTRLPYCSDFIIFPSKTIDVWSNNEQFSNLWLQGREHVNKIVLKATTDRRLCEAAWGSLTKAACEDAFNRYGSTTKASKQWRIDVNDFGWFAAKEMTAVGMTDEADELREWLLEIYKLESAHTGEFPALIAPVSLDCGYPCAIGALQNEPTMEPGALQITSLIHGEDAIKLFIYKEQAFLSAQVWCNANPSSTPSPTQPVSLYTLYGQKEERVLKKIGRNCGILLKSKLAQRSRTIYKSKATKATKVTKATMAIKATKTTDASKVIKEGNLEPFLRRQKRVQEILSVARRARVPTPWSANAKVGSVTHRPRTRSESV